ncbi:sulfur oxidation protein DsrH [Mannheimia sp. USDA-ARS-USMARC-1261]|uniref:Sulfurtransferase complex subunit TusB n=1 Tax=Mannheimia indoligenes TaxID=3103145 RepID=A0ABU7ZGK1_9PAST|nr:sulfurtransferase complex subunit TusB [Mannheimia sp. USDA-ARS-USMARC-1261]AHG72289.1 sulfur oxidation protein DsrH [Mannheimia sp. USDA-ARS-USMARC-1261]
MLYTLSKAQYDDEMLSLLHHLNDNDAVILWQDGVLQAVKNPQFFANLPRCYLLEQDVIARGLQQTLSEFRTISLAECVKLTERYFPQTAL